MGAALALVSRLAETPGRLEGAQMSMATYAPAVAIDAAVEFCVKSIATRQPANAWASSAYVGERSSSWWMSVDTAALATFLSNICIPL